MFIISCKVVLNVAQPCDYLPHRHAWGCRSWCDPGVSQHPSPELTITVFLLLQLNISYPATGCQKLIEVDDERKLRTFYEKRMATEVAADPLGDEWKVKYCMLAEYVVCTHRM